MPAASILQTSLSGLARALVQQGRLSEYDVEAVLGEAAANSRSFVSQLIASKKLSALEVAEVAAQTFGFPLVDFDALDPEQLPKDILDKKLMQAHRVVALHKRGNRLHLAVTDPSNLQVLDDAQFQTGLVVDPVIVEDDKIGRYMESAAKSDTELKKLMEEDTTSIGDLLHNLGDDTSEEVESADDITAASDNELVKLVNKIIIDAYNQNASDIHIEPYPGKKKTRIRFRKDGSLVNYIELPAHYRSPLVTRLKIMCDLDISERRKPQDGKIKFKKFGPLDIELRVATCPTQGGVEDVVMRILAAGKPMKLEQLGLAPKNMENLKSCVEKPYGLFFVCGPTGSGKTTTLHSVLGYLNTPDTKIWTAEDPVEITQEGLRQVQMNPKAGLTFATAMRAFLRCDPDIIMVGEMRDKETTSIGVEASLTGHLVFATLHTNSAPESIVRLLDMGMDPFNFADALLGILAQRLAKRLCPKCKKPYVASQEEMRLMLDEYCEELRNTERFKREGEAAQHAIHEEWMQRFANDKGQFMLYEAVGCDNCDSTGYRGRVGLHELLVGTDPVKKHIQEHARVAEIVATALQQGMRTLKQDGMEKVLQGSTDMRQVRAVCIK
ncbi:MAG: Flp pilus assembly complex ATPase component TadA [Betaproteobacteria bacterium]|nr:Flp pilus assembly complex ATPase component TadA [Betaproteobacteria bacterium]